MRFKSMYLYPNESDVTIGVYNTKEEAVKACVEYRRGDYCLDNKEERMESLMLRNFCICGCGPAELLIEEVE